MTERRALMPISLNRSSSYTDAKNAHWQRLNELKNILYVTARKQILAQVQMYLLLNKLRLKFKLSFTFHKKV